MQVNVGTFRQFVISATRQAPAAAIVAIFANVDGLIIGRLSGQVCGLIRYRFDIIDATAIPVVGTADENSPSLVVAEALAERTGGFNGGPPAHDWRVTTHSAE